MRIVKHAQSTPEYMAFKASDAPFVLYRMLEDSPDGKIIRVFVSHVEGVHKLSKELKPEAWVEDNKTVAMIVMNDLLLNMRKLKVDIGEAQATRFLSQWLSCFDAPISDGHAELRMANTTYRFTHYPRVLQIVGQLNREVR